MSARRHLLRALAGLAAGGAALSATAPALAASGSSVTVSDSSGSVAGQTLTSDTTLTVAGHGTSPGTTYTLSATAPDGTSQSASQRATLTGGPATPSFSIDTTDWHGAEAPNGDWSATLTGGGQAGFTLAIPPSPVNGLSASGDSRQVTLSWTANTEPDLVGYLVTLPNGSNRSVSPGDAGCSVDSHCSVSYQPAAGDAGKTLEFHVAARRNGACGCSAKPITGAAADTSVNIPAPDPSPSPSGNGGSGGSGGSGGKGSGGTPGGGSFLTNGNGTSHDRVGHHGYTSGGKLQAFVPNSHVKLPVPSLPAFTGLSSVLPGGEGSGAVQQGGGYRPTLAYPPGSGHGAGGATVSSGHTVASSFLRVINQSALWRSIGLAGVLLLAATHLLLWLRRTPVEL